MKTLLLLAGRSKRFWPLTEKTLFHVCGKTILEHQVERLRAAGATNIILVGGAHNLDDAKTLFPDLQAVEQENLELGMRGALLSALPHIGNDPVMIVSGNDVIDESGYEDVIHEATKPEVHGALLARKMDRYFPGGYLSVNGSRIVAIVEKPGEGNEPSDLVNIVAHVHNDPAALLAALKTVQPTADDGYELALATLFASHDYQAVPYEGSWQPIKYPWHMLELLPVFLASIDGQTIHPTASVHPTAVISGNVVIEEGVKILPYACITGPCFIGRKTVVGNGALVRGSSVGEACVIGYGTEVKGSVLESNVWTHMTYVGDSVIARNVSFGGGCVTGNFRLDEGEITSVIDGAKIRTGLTKCGAMIGEGVRLGIQVGTNPGVKIGAGTFVAGGTYVAEDIADRMFVRLKEGKVVSSDNKQEMNAVEERDQYKEKMGA